MRFIVVISLWWGVFVNLWNSEQEGLDWSVLGPRLALLTLVSSGVAFAVFLWFAGHVKVSVEIWISSVILLLVAGFAIRTILLSQIRGVLTSMSRSSFRKLVALFVFQTCVVIGAMSYLDSKARTPELPLGIVSFEFGFTNRGMKKIVDSWSQEQLIWAVFLQ